MYNVDLYVHITKIMYFFFLCFISFYTRVPKYIRKAIAYKYNINDLTIEHIVEPEFATIEVLETKVSAVDVDVAVEKYEDKYLIKYKDFTSDYFFTEEEFSLETEKYIQLMCEYETNLNNDLNNIKVVLGKIDQIIELWPTGEGVINKLTKYFDIKDEYNDDPDDYDVYDLFNDLQTDRKEYYEKLKEIEQQEIPEQELKDKAHLYILDKKLDDFINNYVLESTPLGNVYMRYNHNKKSFEYFSNNTIPYRYLEAVGRKYVTTFRCKALFVDLDDELSKAQQRQEQEKQTQEQEKQVQVEKNILENRTSLDRQTLEKDKSTIAKFKNYNKDTKMEQMKPNKNRQSSMVLPQQIKANLPNINTNSTSESKLLKENANRYTWEGRVSNLSILKKVNREIIDKKYALTFADFKKMEQNKR